MAQANRDVCNKLYKIIRAREEIDRLNVEVTRLRTSLYCEAVSFGAAIRSLQEKGQNALAAELMVQRDARYAVNHRHHLVLNKIEGLAGFTGKKGTGIPKGWTSDMVRAAEGFEVPVEEGEAEGIAELEREEARVELCRLTNIVENLAI